MRTSLLKLTIEVLHFLKPVQCEDHFRRLQRRAAVCSGLGTEMQGGNEGQQARQIVVTEMLGEKKPRFLLSVALLLLLLLLLRGIYQASFPTARVL